MERGGSVRLALCLCDFVAGETGWTWRTHSSREAAMNGARMGVTELTVVRGFLPGGDQVAGHEVGEGADAVAVMQTGLRGEFAHGEVE